MFGDKPTQGDNGELARQDLWKSLAYLFAYWNGEVIDLLSFRTPSTNSTTKTSLLYGVGVDHSGRAEFSGSGFLNPGNGGVTMLTFANPSGAETLTCQRVSNNGKHMELRVGSLLDGTSDATGMFWTCTQSAARDGASATGVIDGNWHVFAGRRLDDGHSLWVDGQDVTSSSTSGIDNIDDAGTFVLGGLPGTTTLQYTRDKLLDAGWNRALSDAELTELGRDPFLILRQNEVSPAVFFLTAGGGGGATIPIFHRHYANMRAA